MFQSRYRSEIHSFAKMSLNLITVPPLQSRACTAPSPNMCKSRDTTEFCKFCNSESVLHFLFRCFPSKTDACTRTHTLQATGWLHHEGPGQLWPLPSICGQCLSALSSFSQFLCVSCQSNFVHLCSFVDFSRWVAASETTIRQGLFKDFRAKATAAFSISFAAIMHFALSSCKTLSRTANLFPFYSCAWKKEEKGLYISSYCMLFRYSSELVNHWWTIGEP